MKNYLLIACMLTCLLVECISQSSFDAQEFKEYREQIKDLSYEELMTNYPAPVIYYSERQTKTDYRTFQYMDSIDIRFSLTDYEKELIRDNHFMVSERLSIRSFPEAFVNIYSADLPLFLSTDFFLHALHASYDLMLKDIELKILEPNLMKLLGSMRNQLGDQYSKYESDPSMMQAVKDVDLYLAVAISLMNDEVDSPYYDDSGNFEIILNAIENQSPKVLNMGLFSEHPRKIDISQFTPRGHYTEEFLWSGEKRNLSQYFQAMMWLGRIDFMLTPPPVAPGENEWTEADIKRMARSAMLLNELLMNSGQLSLFQLHEKIIGFFVGPDDNLNPGELEELLASINLSPDEISDEGQWELFQERLDSSDDYGQKIMSNYFIVDKDKENPADLPISYRLLGQKFLLDSYVFSEVVYDRVYHDGEEVLRMMPDPLDIMFVLGNRNALPLLENELNTYSYAYKLEELKYLTDSYDPDFWEQSLYNAWLNAIRELNPDETNSGLPYFMQTTEWQLQKLNTQLSSWAELRHDNVLYAKQSYTGGTSCSFPHVYVEPYPGFFNKLEIFSEKAINFFNNELEELDAQHKEQIIDFFTHFSDHMSKIGLLAEKELRRENFNSGEISYLKTFVNMAMSSGPMIDGWYNELFYEYFSDGGLYSNKRMESDHLVVDVHTQPTDEFGNEIGRIMHVGTGNINLGIFCVGSPSNEYHPTAFVGPVMSFHTKFENNWKRLTDDEWADLFWNSEDQPVRPDWVNHYLADSEGMKRGTGNERNIKGAIYTGTGIAPVAQDNMLAYLFAFPNPASDFTSLRFVLNRPSNSSVEIYNILGEKVKTVLDQQLPAGEYSFELNLRNLDDGFYLVRMFAGSDHKTIRLLKKSR